MEVKKENKKPVTLIIRPSIKKAAKKKAKKEQTSLSQVVEDKLIEYIQ
jgi:predicted HicB family RNase H-like nuclease